MNFNSFVLWLLHNQPLSFVVGCILVASPTQLLWHMHSVWNSTSCAFDWQLQEVCILYTFFRYMLSMLDPIGVCVQWSKPRMEVSKQKWANKGQLRAESCSLNEVSLSWSHMVNNCEDSLNVCIQTYKMTNSHMHRLFCHFANDDAWNWQEVLLTHAGFICPIDNCRIQKSVAF